MRLGFFSKLTAVWVSGCFCLMFASIGWAQSANTNPITSRANTQTKSKPDYTSADWSTPEFWKSKNPLSKDTSGWIFEDGEVRLERPKQRAHLVSPPMPPNFDLSWKWKIAKGTNSGLKYRVRPSSNQLYDNQHVGVEYQIIDDAKNTKLKKSKANTTQVATAAIYGLVEAAPDKNLNPPGQWNQARVVANGNEIKHYLNGQLVASATVGDFAWEVAINKSKFYGVQDFGAPKAGDRFMLTDHGGKVSYKDFQFTALQVSNQPTHPVAKQAAFDKPPYLGNAIRNNWADKNSVVIWTRTTARPEMLADGKPFVAMSKKDAKALEKKTNDPTELLAAQLPDGATLDQMIGACPGSPGQVRLTYFPVSKSRQATTTPWTTTDAATDFTAQWKLENLKPGVSYAAVVEAKPIASDEPTAVVRGRFSTAPKTSAQRDTKFCVTTCHDFIRTDNGLRGHKIYPAMSKIKPDFIVHAGDIEYYDQPGPWAMTIELMRFKWQRIFALPDNREFYKQTTSYFLKDDHDTLKDDCWPGQTYGTVSFEQGVKLFNEEQFPAAGPRYKTVRWGKDLQFWLLEGRDFRSANDAPDGPDKTILGEKQKSWLAETLKASDAKFKLVFSPTPIVGPDRRGKKDNHANKRFAYEGKELRELFSGIDGLIVLCGDRHWQYTSVQPGTNLWEFCCGAGSDNHQKGWKEGDKRHEHRFLRVAGGFLTGEVVYEAADETPSLTLRHHKVTGEEVSRFVFPMPKPQRPPFPKGTSKMLEPVAE